MDREREPAKKVQFRTACDPCTAAKVKCDKKHPACKRCVEVQASCTYSESRKHGKQSWRRKLAQGRTTNIMAATAATTTTSMAAGSDAQVPIVALPGQQLGWDALLGWGMGPWMMDGRGLPSLEPLVINEQPGSGDASAMASSWSFADSDLDAGSFSHWDATKVFPGGATGNSRSESDHENDHPPGPTAPVNQPPGSATSSAHDCEARAISILSSMQHGELGEGAATCSAQPTRFGALNLRPRFDSVITTNRAALDGWSELMRCQCTQCPHLILLYIAILSKMLFWYRIAARDSFAASTAVSAVSEQRGDSSDKAYRRNSEDGPGASQQRDAPPTPDRFAVDLTAIQVGGLRLDAEEQADLRRALLLRELRKTEKAIDQLTDVRRPDDDAADGEVDDIMRSAVAWSVSGIAQVRAQLREVMQQVQSSSEGGGRV